MRIGPGPVFVVEMIAAARRWQTYAARSALVIFLFAALGLAWAKDHRVRGDGGVNLRDYAELGASFTTTILATQLVLVLLAAPAATAGAMCIDKARGNLTLLMTTDLSAIEIVLGKLFARLLPVLGLIVASLPVLFATSLLGGVSGELLVGGFIVLIGAALAGCTVAMVFSVYVGKTHEALLLSYFAILGWLLSYPIMWGLSALPSPDWLFYLNPFSLLMAPTMPNSQATRWDYVFYLLVAVGIFVVATGWVIVRLRRIVLHEANRPARRGKERPFARNRRLHLLDANPVTWYERHRKRLTRAGRLIWFVFIASSLFGSAWVTLLSPNPRNDEMAMMTNVLIVGVGLLLATVGAVTVLADERTRGNLDILFTTPLTTRQIVAAKWRAAFAIVPKVLILPVFVTTVVLIQHLDDTGFFSRGVDPAKRFVMLVLMFTLIMSCGVFLTSVGLWIATNVKQFGRAVGAAVTCYVGVGIGWMFLVMAVSSKDDTALAFISGSPIFTAAFGTAGVMGREPEHTTTSFCCGLAIWSMIYLGASAVLYAATLQVFDRKLGRISLTKALLARPKLGPHRTVKPTPETGIVVESR